MILDALKISGEGGELTLREPARYSLDITLPPLTYP